MTYAHVCRGILIPWNCKWHQNNTQNSSFDRGRLWQHTDATRCVIKLTAPLKHAGLKNVCCTLFLRMQRSYHRWAAHTLCPNDAALLSDGETHLEAPNLFKKTYCPTSAGGRENPIIPVFPLHLRRLSRSVLSGLFLCTLCPATPFETISWCHLFVSWRLRVLTRSCLFTITLLLRKKDGGGQ